LITVIHNAAIVTVNDDDAVHYDAAIAIDGDRIAAIGPTYCSAIPTRSGSTAPTRW
jgi:predicted amidohydrolase YtcJ